jgi:hypothetical protein
MGESPVCCLTKISWRSASFSNKGLSGNMPFCHLFVQNLSKKLALKKQKQVQNHTVFSKVTCQGQREQNWMRQRSRAGQSGPRPLWKTKPRSEERPGLNKSAMSIWTKSE